MRGTRIALASLSLALVVACGGATAEAPPSGPPVVANASAEDQTCSRDAECVLVQDCCGCQRQGVQRAVHRDRVEALVEASQTECAEVTCLYNDTNWWIDGIVNSDEDIDALLTAGDERFDYFL